MKEDSIHLKDNWEKWIDEFSLVDLVEKFLKKDEAKQPLSKVKVDIPKPPEKW